MRSQGAMEFEAENYSHPGAATQISGERDMGLPKYKKLTHVQRKE